MNKLIDKAKKSKLNLVKEKTIKQEKLTSITRNAYSAIRSFRLDDASWNSLMKKLEELNLISTRKISATRLIKALIFLGEKISVEEMFKALKEISV